MRTTTPPLGLSAWETRRRNRRRRVTHHAILATGLLGLAIYVTPPAYNPLVWAGILIVPAAIEDVPIAQMNLAIEVRTADLPKRRPSLSAARTADQIEAAHVVAVVTTYKETPTTELLVSSDTSDIVVSGTGEPMHAVSTSLSDPQPPTVVRKTAAVPKPALIQLDEDMTMFRKRAFDRER